jgi:DNA-binding GntR family transcriptional regulator
VATTKRDEVTAKLTAAITLGEYLPCDRLPSESELCRKYDVSRITVRAALISLANDGLVESVKGSGWYVRTDQRLRFPLLDFHANRAGSSADVWNSWIASLERTGSCRLEVAHVVPPPDVRIALHLDQDQMCVRRRRVRLVDDKPWSLSVAYWPMWLAAGTELGATGVGAAVDMQNPSPLKFAAMRGYPSVRDEYQIGSRMPSELEAEELGTGRGVPVITLSTISTTIKELPLRRTDDIYPAHRFLLIVTQDHENDHE